MKLKNGLLPGTSLKPMTILAVAAGPSAPTTGVEGPAVNPFGSSIQLTTSEGVTVRPLQETFTMGRDAGNDLALPDDPMVSYQHACIRHVGDTYVVEDLQSTNGTFLERELKVTRITSPQQLLPNDVIRVGSTLLVFDMDVASDNPPVSPPASEPDAPPLVPEEPDFATDVLGQTKEGRILPVFMEPPEGNERIDRARTLRLLFG